MTDCERQKEKRRKRPIKSKQGLPSTDEGKLPYPALAPVVFFFLKQTTWVRSWCLFLVTKPCMDYISLLMVLLNCVPLGMYKPCGEMSENLQVLDSLFFAFFLSEMIIKTVALGVFGHKGSYLSSNWNKFDFFIISGEVLDHILASLGILSGLQVFQTLRPMRLIGRVPSMRVLVTVIVDTLPMLANVLVLYIFFIHIFGVVGVQMWAGQLRNRCFQGEVVPTKYNISLSPYYVSKYGEKSPFICSPDNKNGMRRCHDVPPYTEDGVTCSLDPHHHDSAADELVPAVVGANTTSCVNWNLYYNICRAGEHNPQMGAINFDNIGYAWIAIFQVVTLEGWTEIMYYVMDANSFWSFVFFTLVTIMGSFVMMNVCAVVIATQFSETMEREVEEPHSGLSVKNIFEKFISFTSGIFNRLNKVNPDSWNPSVEGQRQWQGNRGIMSYFWKQDKKKLKRIVQSKFFDRAIMLAVLLSVLTIAIEHHKQPKVLTDVLNTSNIIFTIVFFMEMVLKLLALTWSYFKDKNNIFDFAIVIISLWEIIAKADGRLSALRAFRLLRFVRLVHFLPYLKKQLLVLKRTIEKAAALCMLLLFATFIFSVLGMHLFGCKFSFKTTHGETVTDRKNFDSLLWSMVTVFQILTHEDWNLVLYNAMIATSPWSALYFVALIIFGKHVLLNVLVGIVVKSYQAKTSPSSSPCVSASSTPRSLPPEDDFSSTDGTKIIFQTSSSSSDSALSLRGPTRSTAISLPPGEDFSPTDNDMKKTSSSSSPHLPTRCTSSSLPPEDEFSPTDNNMEHTSSSSSESALSLHGPISSTAVSLSPEDEFLPTNNNTKDTCSPSSSPHVPTSSTPSSLPPEDEFSPTDNNKKHTSSSSSPHVPTSSTPSSLPPEDEFSLTDNNKKKTSSSSSPHVPTSSTPSSLPPEDDFLLTDNNKKKTSSSSSESALSLHGPKSSTAVSLSPEDDFLPTNNTKKNTSSSSSPHVPTISTVVSLRSEEDFLPTNNTKKNSPSRPEQHCSVSVPNESTMINAAPEEDSAPANKDNETWLIRTFPSVQKVLCWCKVHEEWSFYVLSPENKFRSFCQRVISHKMFDHMVLLFILLSCVTIAMERPAIDPNSMERRILKTSRYVFSAVFFVEMLFKVLALGVVIGKESYCKSSWNIMDGSLVILSVVHIFVSLVNTKKNNVLGMVKVLRLLRALRPLRVIKRAPRLKLAVEALIASVKPIGNIVLICGAFFFFFGILGVQLFKGKFYYCVGQDTRAITNMTDCLSANYRWVRKTYNFDDLPQALMSLFVMYSKDGWVNIMYDGLDAVGVDKQPVTNYNSWMLIFFISFMIVSIFLLDMFIGVMVETFHECLNKQKTDDALPADEGEVVDELTADKEGIADGQTDRGAGHVPDPVKEPYYADYSPLRQSIHRLCTSDFLDLFMTVIIIISVLIMAFEHYNQPKYVEKLMEYSYYMFTAILIAEVLLKIVAFGALRFIKNRWNLLDVAIVVVSVISIIFTEMKMADAIPINPSILRVCRVLRLAQVLKAKKIRVLLKTVIKTLSQVGNLCLLFTFFFFIYAALGVELFGKLECTEDNPCLGIHRYANFSHFGMALLTLYKVCTGDNWSGIMKDTLRECHEGDECVSYLSWVSPVYFTSFVIMAQFVLVNLVVASIMQALEESNEEEELRELEQAPQSPGAPDLAPDPAPDMAPALAPVYPTLRSTEKFQAHVTTVLF